MLESPGLLRIEPRLGTSVVAERREGKAPRRFGPLSLREVHQFRFVAKGYARATVRHARDGGGPAALCATLGEQQETVRRMDPTASSQDDFEFHRLIMSYSGNGALLDLHAGYHAVRMESQWPPARRREPLGEVIVEDEDILRTLSQRDPEGATSSCILPTARTAGRWRGDRRCAVRRRPGRPAKGRDETWSLHEIFAPCPAQVHLSPYNCCNFGQTISTLIQIELTWLSSNFSHVSD